MSTQIISRASSSYETGESSSAAPSASAIISPEQQQLLVKQLLLPGILEGFSESEHEALFSENGLTFEDTSGQRHTIRFVPTDDDTDQLLVEHFQSGDKYEGTFLRVYKDVVGQVWKWSEATQEGMLLSTGSCAMGESERKEARPFELALTGKATVLSNDSSVAFEVLEEIGPYFAKKMEAKSSVEAFLAEAGFTELYLKVPAQLKCAIEDLWQLDSEEQEEFAQSVQELLKALSQYPDFFGGVEKILFGGSYLIKGFSEAIKGFQTASAALGPQMFSLYQKFESLKLSPEIKARMEQMEQEATVLEQRSIELEARASALDTRESELDTREDDSDQRADLLEHLKRKAQASHARIAQEAIDGESTRLQTEARQVLARERAELRSQYQRLTKLVLLANIILFFAVYAVSYTSSDEGA